MMVAECQASLIVVQLVGWADYAASDLEQSVDILSEVVASAAAYESALEAGELVTQPVPGGLGVFFLNDQTGAVRCALELSDLFQDLPSLVARMAIHHGVVSGELVDAALALINGSETGKLVLSESYAGLIANVAGPDPVAGGQRLLVVGGGGEALRSQLEAALQIGGDATEPLTWASSLEERIRTADVVVALISRDTEADELLQYQLDIAMDERRRRGAPQILPVWLRHLPSPEVPLSSLDQNLHQVLWEGPADIERIASEVRGLLKLGQVETDPELLRTAGGAVSSDSRLYVRRKADAALESALDLRESIVLLKGSRQIGKTSLIGHGQAYAAKAGVRTVFTDFQQLSSRQFESDELFCRVVSTTLAHQLGIPFDFDAEWIGAFGANLNMDRFMRMFLDASPEPLVWFIDEADRLFTAPFASDFYGLVRSWHNSRATDRNGMWKRLTVVIAYATEAHLFIKDLNQSPFNVGLMVDIPMFSIANTTDLNERFGRPIKNPADVTRLQDLLGGQPFLTRRALETLHRGDLDFEGLMAAADSEEGPFGDHLKRILASVCQLPTVWDALLQSLSDPLVPESDGLHRLIASGILVRSPDRRLSLRCELYRRFLARFARR